MKALRLTSSAVLVFVLLLTAGPVQAGTGPALNTFVKREMARAHVPGLAAGIVKDGELVWSHGYGWADIKGRVRASPDTLFMLASVSKTVTGTAVMQLVESGDLDLGADVNRYLPFTVRHPRHREKKITVQQLLTHTSGIRDHDPFLTGLYSQGDSPIPLGRFLERYLDPQGRDYNAQRNFYNHAPGQRFEYSNTGFALLGFLVETVSAEPFDTYCRDHIFEPLAMTETAWFLRDLDATKLATPYEYRRGRYVSYGQYGYPDYPNGQLRSSVRELARFLTAHIEAGRLDGQIILRPRSARAMRTVQHPEIASDTGLALFLDRIANLPVVGHDGGDYGASTQMWFSRPHRLGVILLTNGDALETREEQALQRILVRLTKEAKAWR
jgi:CubicO group peptidase (beta-lactamase class C family)